MSLRGPAPKALRGGRRPGEREARVWWDGWDGWDGRWSKVSFKILETLWAFRTCIHILVYKIKIVTNILLGFKIWCQVGGWGTLSSKLPYSSDFSNIWFQKLIWWDGPENCPLNFFKLCVHLEHYIYIYTCKKMKNVTNLLMGLKILNPNVNLT